MEDSRATSLAFVEANAEALGSSQRPERQEGPVRGRGGTCLTRAIGCNR
jgi:hypothetical protein